MLSGHYVQLLVRAGIGNEVALAQMEALEFEVGVEHGEAKNRTGHRLTEDYFDLLVANRTGERQPNRHTTILHAVSLAVQVTGILTIPSHRPRHLW